MKKVEELPKVSIVIPVSYTHLDVYKRQQLFIWERWPMTDLHCHILPAIDDGAKNAKVSMELLRMQNDAGDVYKRQLFARQRRDGQQ